MSMSLLPPAQFTRRILLMGIGSSPAILTETLYALALQTEPAYLPTEIHIITTLKGRELMQPLLGNNGQLRALAQDYHLDLPEVSDHAIYIIADEQGRPLTDIISVQDNEATANFITRTVCHLTSDASSSLHVSIAGGRKTMSYYMGYALSLYGRMQDRLTHVLVDESVITQQFFYPKPQSPITVMLADVPFVRLRAVWEFAEELTQGKYNFNQTIDLVQQQFNPITIEVNSQDLYCGNILIENIKRTNFVIYSWLLDRHKDNKEPLRFYGDESNKIYAEELLIMYRRLYNSNGISKMEQALRKGMNAAYIRPHITRCNNLLKAHLKGASKYYCIQSQEYQEYQEKQGRSTVVAYTEYFLPNLLNSQNISLNIPCENLKNKH